MRRTIFNVATQNVHFICLHIWISHTPTSNSNNYNLIAIRTYKRPYLNETARNDGADEHLNSPMHIS